VDAEVAADTATAELHDEFEFKQLLYQIEARLLVVARFLSEVHGADAVFAASSDELERGINHRCKLRRLYAYIRSQRVKASRKPRGNPTRMWEPMIAANDVSASTATLNVSPYCSCRSSRVFDLASGSNNVNEATDNDGNASPPSSFSFDFLFFWLCCGAMYTSVVASSGTVPTRTVGWQTTRDQTNAKYASSTT
jgi:hypothetical protein